MPRSANPQKHALPLLLAAALLVLSLSSLCAQDIKPSDRKAYGQAIEQYNRRNYSEAAKTLRRVASRNPQAPDPQFWLGMTAVKDGFNVTAIRRYFTRCIELAPDYPHPLAHYYMALILYTDDRFDEAVQQLQLYFSQAEGSTDRAVTAVYEEASNYLYWSQFLAEAVLSKVPFEPRRVEGVSSNHNEMLPYPSADGKTIYYLREMPLAQGRTFYHRELEEKAWRICFSRWQDSLFSTGTPLGKPFGSRDPEGSVCLTAAGDELYYSIIRDDGGYANSDIYRVRRVDGEWQQPDNCGANVNGNRSWESQPTISADGNLLIFASNRKGGQGGIDLWRCHRLANGEWSRAENLGPAVNTAGNEKAPFLAADGRTLYFLSDGWQGFGGYDIYFANLDDPYGNRPTNLGLPVNTESDELSFAVSADGRKAYFSGRLETSRSSDILEFDLYPAARPEPMRLVRFSVSGPTGQPLAATVRLASGARYKSSSAPVAMLSEANDDVALILSDGMFPAIISLRHSDIARGHLPPPLTLRPSVPGSAHPLLLSDGLEDRMKALAQWLIDNPRVRLSIECPHDSDARRVLAMLKSHGLRAERFAIRSGSAISKPQLVVQ